MQNVNPLTVSVWTLISSGVLCLHKRGSDVQIDSGNTILKHRTSSQISFRKSIQALRLKADRWQNTLKKIATEWYLRPNNYCNRINLKLHECSIDGTNQPALLNVNELNKVDNLDILNCSFYNTLVRTTT